jgi:hypothetical protein
MTQPERSEMVAEVATILHDLEIGCYDDSEDPKPNPCESTYHAEDAERLFTYIDDHSLPTRTEPDRLSPSRGVARGCLSGCLLWLVILGGAVLIAEHVL